MATMITTTTYKSCPLKKRPIVYESEEEPAQILPAAQTMPTEIILASRKYYLTTDPVVNSVTIKQEPELQLVYNEQPQDLSLKRKASVDFEEYAVPAKRDCVLNLSKDISDMTTTIEPTTKSSSTTYHYRPDSPANSVHSHHSELVMSSSSAMLSPPAEYDAADYYGTQQPPVDIHLRGLTAATSGYTTASNNYKSAFMVAAGATPITALWSAYQPGVPNIHAIFPSPASSIAASPRSVYSYQHMTPPSSPASEAGSEPEDLTVRNDIPLPALYHNTANAYSSTSSSNSLKAPKTSTTLGVSNRALNSSNNSHTATNTTTAHNSNSNNTANKHSPNYRFKCDKCNKMYSTSIGLSKHQQFHCPAAECNQDKKQHSCHECGKLYTSVGALKMHIRTHTLPCKCPICGKAFSRPWLLQGHIRTHTGEKPFQCSDCPRSFADRSNLRAHQQTHVEVKKYACKVCHKSFSRMSLLTKHVSSNCTITIA